MTTAGRSFPQFEGSSEKSDLPEAITQAVAQAKAELQQDFVAWELVTLKGQDGGFAGVTQLTAVIQITGNQPPAQVRALGLIHQGTAGVDVNDLTNTGTRAIGITATAVAATPRTIALQCPAGTPVLVSGSTTRNTTVAQVIGGVAVGANLQPSYQQAAYAPCQIAYRFSFYTRPWSVSFAALAGNSSDNFTLSSTDADINLPTVGLSSPDLFDLTLTA